MTESLSDAVAGEIRAEQARQRKTQEDLAQCLGITPQAVSRKLAGERPLRLDEVQRLADYFGVPITSLIRERVA
jgi:transcriptional regulator with XRE-family HTH domain